MEDGFSMLRGEVPITNQEVFSNRYQLVSRIKISPVKYHWHSNQTSGQASSPGIVCHQKINSMLFLWVDFLPHIAELGQLLFYLSFPCSFQFLYFCFISLFLVSWVFLFTLFALKKREVERESIILVR